MEPFKVEIEVADSIADSDLELEVALKKVNSVLHTIIGRFFVQHKANVAHPTMGGMINASAQLDQAVAQLAGPARVERVAGLMAPPRRAN